MAAIKFVAVTDKKSHHEEIKRLTYMAGGALVREKVRRDTSSAFEGELECISEGGTLYRMIKEGGLCAHINIVN
jgi:hypothetical protein